MDSRVETLETEVTTMKEGMDEMRAQMGELNSRMGHLGSDMEAIKGYLRDLREATLGKEGGDKGKAPMQQEPSPSYSPPGREPSIPPPERTEEVEEGGRGAHRESRDERIGESRRDLQYRRLDLQLFEGEGALDWLARVERYF